MTRRAYVADAPAERADPDVEPSTSIGRARSGIIRRMKSLRAPASFARPITAALAATLLSACGRSLSPSAGAGMGGRERGRGRVGDGDLHGAPHPGRPLGGDVLRPALAQRSPARERLPAPHRVLQPARAQHPRRVRHLDDRGDRRLLPGGVRLPPLHRRHRSLFAPGDATGRPRSERQRTAPRHRSHLAGARAAQADLAPVARPRGRLLPAGHPRLHAHRGLPPPAPHALRPGGDRRAPGRRRIGRRPERERGLARRREAGLRRDQRRGRRPRGRRRRDRGRRHPGHERRPPRGLHHRRPHRGARGGARRRSPRPSPRRRPSPPSGRSPPRP